MKVQYVLGWRRIKSRATTSKTTQRITMMYETSQGHYSTKTSHTHSGSAIKEYSQHRNVLSMPVKGTKTVMTSIALGN